MPQFARPASDLSLDGWSTPSFSVIDEVSPSDADKTESPLAPAGASLRVSLSTLGDPQVSTGHIVRYRYQKNTAGGAQINLTVRLFSGINQIREWTHTNIGNGFVTAAQTLTALEASAISDYAALEFQFIADQA